MPKITILYDDKKVEPLSGVRENDKIIITLPANINSIGIIQLKYSD